MADVHNTWSERIVGRLGGGACDCVVERDWLARPGGLARWGTDTTLPKWTKAYPARCPPLNDAQHAEELTVRATRRVAP